MKKEELKERLQLIFDDVNDNNKDKAGFDIIANDNYKEITFTHAVRAIAITDDIVFTFGGYGTHFEIVQTAENDFDFDEVIDEFLKYIKDYDKNITLNDLCIRKAEIL